MIIQAYTKSRFLPLSAIAVLTIGLMAAVAGMVWAQAGQDRQAWHDSYGSLTPQERIVESQDLLLRGNDNYKRVKALEKIYDDAIALGTPGRAVEILEEAIASVQDRRVKGRAQYELAKIHRAEGRYELARQWFLEVEKTTDDPRDLSNTRYQLAEDDWQAGRYADSLDRFLEWLAHHSNKELQKLDYFALFECVNRCLQKFEASAGQDAFVSFDASYEKWAADPGASQPALLLAQAIRHRVASEYEQALESVATVRDGDDAYWTVGASLTEVSVCLRLGDTQQALEILEALSTNAAYDKQLTQYLAIDSCYLIWDGWPEQVVAATEWWRGTELANDPLRRSEVRWPQLFTNYSVALLYAKRTEDSTVVLEEIVADGRTDSKWYEFAAILLSQKCVRAGQLARAREMLLPVYRRSKTDEIRVGTADALAQLNLAEKDYAKVAAFIHEVLVFPDRPGSDGPGSTRLKKDAEQLHGTMKRHIKE